jgi:uncharacterized coiled-coil protein SlyX
VARLDGAIYHPAIRKVFMDVLIIPQCDVAQRVSQKKHRTLQEQQSTITALKGMVAQQQKQIEVLTATVRNERKDRAKRNGAATGRCRERGGRRP